MKTTLNSTLGLVVAWALTQPHQAALADQLSTKQYEPSIKAFAARPLIFEPGPAAQGSQAEAVTPIFMARGKGYELLLAPTQTVLVLADPAGPAVAGASATEQGPRPALKSRLVRMKLAGANLNARLSGLEPLAAKVNYFIGNDPGQWRTNVPTYAKVKAQNVYPGIDLVYYGNGRQLEFDFVVAPGVDPNQIAMSFEGAEKVELADNGDLVLQASGQELRHRKPLVYQMLDDARKEIAASFKVNGTHEARFEIGACDRALPLVIDPVLTYASYLGGSLADYAKNVAVDAFGNFYVAGNTFSTNFPVVGLSPPGTTGPVSLGESPGFVSKFRPDGTLVYSTYMFENTPLNGLAVDQYGNAYVTGSGGYVPTTPGAYQPQPAGGGDAYVAKLSSDGATLIYATYLGGGDGDCCDHVGQDVGMNIAVDSSGAAYVCGYTTSTNFPVTSNAFQRSYGGTGSRFQLGDAFVAKLDPSGSNLVYATYLGGMGDDIATDITVDSAGQAYVTGATFSTNFPTAGTPFQPTLHGGADAFVAKLSADGSGLIYSTFLGGSGDENTDNIQYSHNGIAIDSAGSAFVTGQTSSSDFPTVNALQTVYGSDPDAFVAKLSPDGSALVYSTYLGCEHSTLGHGIAVDGAGSAYVAGEARSDEYLSPIVNPVPATPGQGDGTFVAKISGDGQTLLYRTFLESVGYFSFTGSGAIALDARDNAYVAGRTFATNLPVTATAVQPTNAGPVVYPGPYPGPGDAFVAIISSAAEPPPPMPVAFIDCSFLNGVLVGGTPADGSVWGANAISGKCYANWANGICLSNATPCAQVTFTPPLNSDFPVGTNVIHGAIHDVTGAIDSFTFTFIVLANQPPTITCPTNIVTSTSPGQCSAVVNYPAPTATDTCGNQLTVTASPAPGSLFPRGTTTVNCTAIDGSGNSSSCSFTVTVNDTQAPTIICPANVVTNAASGQCYQIVNFNPVVSDNCGGSSLSVACSPPSGSAFPVGTTVVMCTATDTSGNSASCSFTVTVSKPISISSSFNGTAINAGNSIWFNSVLKPSGLGSNPVTIRFFNQAITSANFNVSVPDAAVTFDPAATNASTAFVGGQWVTRVPSSGLAGNTFLAGLSYPVPVSLPGGINPVTWSGTFLSDTPGVTLQWQWAAAVYTNFPSGSDPNNALGVKPTDDNKASIYKNSDHAGTPENYKTYVVGGARGGGGANYTGSYSGTGSVTPCVNH